MQLGPSEVYIEVISEGYVRVTSGASTHRNLPVLDEDRFFLRSLKYMAFRKSIESSVSS